MHLLCSTNIAFHLPLHFFNCHSSIVSTPLIDFDNDGTPLAFLPPSCGISQCAYDKAEV